MPFDPDFSFERLEARVAAAYRETLTDYRAAAQTWSVAAMIEIAAKYARGDEAGPPITLPGPR